MSTSSVIQEVSVLLKDLLTQELGSGLTADIVSPVDVKAPLDLSIWLYQVTPNEHLRNAPNLRLRTEEFEHLPPLSLDLYYLLTPLQADESQNQITLGRALRVLYDNSILTLNAVGNVEELHLSICQRSIEELAKVWEAMQKPYRLSVCFEVRVVRIDSERKLNPGRILERSTAFEGMPQEGAA
jgi:hypothetical protein